MSQADFIHSIEQYRNQVPVLVIEDINLGNKSVTNDIENVVSDIAKMEKINPADYLIVFKDNEPKWDMWDHSKQQFILLQEDTWYFAIGKYLQSKSLATS